MSGVTTGDFRRDLLALAFLGEPLPWNQLLIALCVKVPTTNSAPSQLAEPIGGGYLREAAALGGPNWTINNNNEVVNTGSIYWPVATGNWGTIHGWAIIAMDGVTVLDKVLAVGTLVEPYRVVTGVRPYLVPGSITFGLYDYA